MGSHASRIRRPGFRLVPLSVGVLGMAQVVGCSAPIDDPLAGLPETIGTEKISYDIQRGTAAHDWALDAALTSGLSEAAVASATGFTAPGPFQFQSYALHAPGGQGGSMIDAFVAAFDFRIDRTWSETVAGRQVVRVLPVGFKSRRGFLRLLG